jgi:flagellar secretion chaperone FliS
MRHASHAYLEEGILQADTLKLVQTMYRAAIDSVVKAKIFLANGEIRQRSLEITRAGEILAELSHGLDLEQGGDLAARLQQLYDYMQRRLLEANALQSAGELAEVESLLRTILDAWENCEPHKSPASQVAPESSTTETASGDASGNSYTWNHQLRYACTPAP